MSARVRVYGCVCVPNDVALQSEKTQTNHPSHPSVYISGLHASHGKDAELDAVPNHSAHE